MSQEGFGETGEEILKELSPDYVYAAKTDQSALDETGSTPQLQ